MHCLASIERVRLRAWPAVWLAMCSLLLVITESSTSAPDALEAGFDIRNAKTTLVDGVYLLDADISFIFSEEALEAIENGVPVTIILEMQVLRQRGLIWDNLWWDKKIAQLEGKFRIETRPLSKTYLLRNLNSGELQVFASFGKLLVGLGKIRNFPLLDEHLLGDEKECNWSGQKCTFNVFYNSIHFSPSKQAI